ncbi:MAG: bifunctional demethylmenaquinone methyltransferase/2-methoxy-6-polyprenyl-1,4-benzoquinol methylase UbiE [Clostridia bacterium]|nr:bifunctional demethylmenaquinone methyltransferase/2-methoxy-6-polyprenyl-1,4-benzoquinol methylase UbiE [Clostridia bacterium]MDH7573412.1 bifunctional demethylmenaquinone methyltransferase/2-methoxy-6-polyprenyl-1,4-benzoquinol methylase UbiE [Clostridia bacterium]
MKPATGIDLTGPKKEAFIRNLFDGIAHRYDFLNTVLSFNLDKRWRRFAAAQTGLGSGGRALDVCCGTGMLALELARLAGPRGEVVGLDFSEAMLGVAARRLARLPEGAVIRLVRGNAVALPFPDNSFDCATIAFALRNVPDVEMTLREMRRVVRPGGRVVSLELAQPGAFGFRQAYQLYFYYLVPFLGRLGVGFGGPYRYLPESVRRFPHQREVLALFGRIGLVDSVLYELTGGVAAVHVGTKAWSDTADCCMPEGGRPEEETDWLTRTSVPS